MGHCPNTLGKHWDSRSFIKCHVWVPCVVSVIYDGKPHFTEVSLLTHVHHFSGGPWGRMEHCGFIKCHLGDASGIFRGLC